MKIFEFCKWNNVTFLHKTTFLVSFQISILSSLLKIISHISPHLLSPYIYAKKSFKFLMMQIKLHPTILTLNYFMSIKNSDSRVEGNVLELHQVRRSQMGGYLCVAMNGHPPAVSRKIQLLVNCEFNIYSNWTLLEK